MGRSFGSLGTRVVTQVRRREGCRELRNPLCKGRLESEIMLIVACKATSKVNTVLAYEHSLWSDFRLLLFFFFCNICSFIGVFVCLYISLIPSSLAKKTAQFIKTRFPFTYVPFLSLFKINLKLLASK